MSEDDRPFVVLKFLTHEGKRLTSDDDVYYAVGLTRWFTTELDENMEVRIKWPPTSVDAGNLVRKEKSPDPNWGEEIVLIKRFYDLYDKAAASCKGYVEDSNYETDHRELGRGHRTKRKIQRLDSESENESDSGLQNSRVKKGKTRSSNKNLQKLKKTIPAPPPVSFVMPRRSPHELVRQQTLELEKQPLKKININKISENENQVTKRIFNMKKKIQEEKAENTTLSEKLRQLLSNKKLQKSCKDKPTLYQDEKTLEHQNVDDFDLDKIENFENQNFEKENITSTIPEKQIVSEYCPSSTDTKILSPSSSEKDFVYNSPSEELKRNSSLSHLSSSAVGRGSFNVKSHSNDNYLYQSEKSESSSSQNKSHSNDDYMYQFEKSEGSFFQNKDADISLVCLIKTYHNEIKKELKELNSKLDFCLLNQEKLHRYILPGEKTIKRPTGFHSLPVKSEQELQALEKFLSNDANLSAASMYFGRFVDKNSLDNSVRKILRNVICNDVANKYSFQGAKGKKI
ncbi:uncharacterized protein LOC118647630 isoform X1 [Monomorium pharaonis]|uniref:uncharacterized protein LOC118647630 isoform X1 n=2 Tax=Monomorium pharaonis TaxID=307658 RepID=UPI0017478829|nr:uncharacterized protein LOC118647630 isoform X1 [Monomorium pharaonis]XP_036148773.1 uncharacterized protein LOC118647630 isoform X1 [Monomorium pharaonis]XP_036148774.1 uncharacterized protein LOC118647630 isoform X1 [Monomorium pharaonis]